MTDQPLTCEQLQDAFGNEANYGVWGGGDETEGARFPDGTAWAFCTNWSGYVRRVLGARAELYGFSDDENPTSSIAAQCGGHDFAVVDGRFIVDGWSPNVEGTGPAVLDLDNPDEAEQIERLYGDRSMWERNEGLEQYLDNESEQERTKAFEGTYFPDFEPVALPVPGM